MINLFKLIILIWYLGSIIVMFKFASEDIEKYKQKKSMLINKITLYDLIEYLLVSLVCLILGFIGWIIFLMEFEKGCKYIINHIINILKDSIVWEKSNKNDR